MKNLNLIKFIGFSVISSTVSDIIFECMNNIGRDTDQIIAIKVEAEKIRLENEKLEMELIKRKNKQLKKELGYDYDEENK